jgi:hypothetical protein
MRKIAQFGKYIRSLAIPPWTSFIVFLKLVLEKYEREGVDWINLAQDTDFRRPLVNMVVTLRVPQNVGV